MPDEHVKTLVSHGSAPPEPSSDATAATLPATPWSGEPGEGGDGTAPSSGEVIDGYRIVRQLGRGGMGVVLLAHDERLDRPVAIKLVRPDLALADFRARLVSEARAMARVRHPNVLNVHALGEHEGAPYIVMELVEGKTLEQWMAERTGPPDVERAMSILDQICQGVAAIHAAETAHRDLKPANILLDAELRPRVADLGVAALCRGRLRHEVVGTPAYMAPEVIMADDRDPVDLPRADVYSLACMAYELLTGKRPFEATGLLQGARGRPARPTELRSELPGAFDDALLAALAEDPTERTPTVAALRSALLSAHDSGPDRILVAEDDDDFRTVLALALSREFPLAEIESVADGNAALAAFERRLPSVLVIDLDLPGLDGLELTRIVRRRASAAAVPILVLTGSGGPDEWKRLSSIGADRFLVKPVHLDDVVQLIRKALREKASGSPSARVESKK